MTVRLKRQPFYRAVIVGTGPNTVSSWRVTGPWMPSRGAARSFIKQRRHIRGRYAHCFAYLLVAHPKEPAHDR